MKRFLSITVFLALGIAVVPCRLEAQDNDKCLDRNRVIIPPQARPYGKTYGEWSAEWWKWVLRLPVTGHPLFDSTGDNAGAGQSGPVWFLGGTYTVVYSEPGHAVGVANRTIVVPPGKALFFPILNNESDNVGVEPPMTIPQLRSLTSANQDAATNMVCTIDGIPVRGLANGLTSPYRVQSPPFRFWMPATDNLYQSYGVDFSGTAYPAVSDGVFLMVKPLPPGAHTIHFGGDLVGANGTPTFSLDITYTIFVSAHPPSIVPPSRRAYGKTYGEWSERFWQWCFGLPVTGHPLYDAVGTDAAVGQSGPVWFLGSTFTLADVGGGHLVGVAQRTITVPQGKALFFPILNGEQNNAEFVPPPDPLYTPEQLREMLRAGMDGATNMVCKIDGWTIPGLSNVLTTPYRAQSPVFSFELPAQDNILQSNGLDVSGTVDPVVADGVYLLLRPLPPGFHKIKFSGDVLGAEGTPIFSLDIQYDITVTRGHARGDERDGHQDDH
jgi:hypothetical protein